MLQFLLHEHHIFNQLKENRENKKIKKEEENNFISLLFIFTFRRKTNYIVPNITIVGIFLLGWNWGDLSPLRYELSV